MQPHRKETIEAAGFGSATIRYLCVGLRRAAACLGFRAAGQALRAALLHGSTTALLLGATLEALLAAAELGVGGAAGHLRFATGKVGRTAILGFLIGSGQPGKKETEAEERTGK
jgi:hypothetical protein